MLPLNSMAPPTPLPPTPPHTHSPTCTPHTLPHSPYTLSTHQALRGGITYVTKWLVTKVVWWDLRPQWCELLYRHRCTPPARLEALLRRSLDDALATMTELLPPVGVAHGGTP